MNLDRKNMYNKEKNSEEMSIAIKDIRNQSSQNRLSSILEHSPTNNHLFNPDLESTQPNQNCSTDVIVSEQAHINNHHHNKRQMKCQKLKQQN